MLSAHETLAALTIPLDHVRVPADEVIEGRPTTGTRALANIGGTEFGVWEMTPGTVRAIEEDEIFVVLFGQARIRFEDDGSEQHVSAGDVMRLNTGARTVWTVTSTLRKAYIAT